MIKKLTLCSAFMLMSAGVVQAAELAISFSDQSAQLALNQEVGDYYEGRTIFGIRGLYNDRKDTELVSGSFNVLGPVGRTGLEIGAGVGLYYVNSSPGARNDEIAAGGIGALVSFVPPDLPKLGFSLGVYYCPEIFNLMDGEGLWDAEVEASYEIAPGAKAFATYTEIEAEIENYRGDRTLDKTLRAGIALTF
ncbi:MAG: hypothetical protein LC633_08210 [Desulfobulbaceae bacterium]|nr:hypothetical protein [Desulfobulbaceae bacterium]